MYRVLIPKFRNSSPVVQVFCKKSALRNFAKFTGKRLCQGLFFNKLAGLRSATLLKKRLWHGCFHVNFTKFLRTPFLTEHLQRLLLQFWRINKGKTVIGDLLTPPNLKMVINKTNSPTAMLQNVSFIGSNIIIDTSQEETTRGVLLKKVFLIISQNSQENTCARVSFPVKLQGLQPATLLKKRL